MIVERIKAITVFSSFDVITLIVKTAKTIHVSPDWIAIIIINMETKKLNVSISGNLRWRDVHLAWAQ